MEQINTEITKEIPGQPKQKAKKTLTRDLVREEKAREKIRRILDASPHQLDRMKKNPNED